MSDSTPDPRIVLLAYTRKLLDLGASIEATVRQVEKFVLGEILPKAETLRGPHRVRIPSRNALIFIPTVYPVGNAGLVFEARDLKTVDPAVEARLLTVDTIEIKTGETVSFPIKLTFRVRCALKHNRNMFVESESEFLVES